VHFVGSRKTASEVDTADIVSLFRFISREAVKAAAAAGTDAAFALKLVVMTACRKRSNYCVIVGYTGPTHTPHRCVCVKESGT